MFTALLKGTLSQFPMPEPKVPEDRSIYLVEEDQEPEGTGEAVADSISTALFISYKNSKGEVSERRISVKTLDRSESGHLLIRAYCYERKALRTFRADRIIQAIDIETGEVLDTQEKILESFGLVEKELASDPKTATRKALRKCRHALNVLVYLARCDGRFHYDEKDVVIHYLVDECFDCDFDDEYLLARLGRLYPDTDAFFDSLDYLEENDEDGLNKVARYAAFFSAVVLVSLRVKRSFSEICFIITLANSTGTAFPIWREAEVIPP